MSETVLIVGSTGIVGVSGVRAALNSGRKVLAVVRNDQSAQKIYDFIGSKDNITVAQADIMADDGVQKVVDQVRAGKLPSFQHVFSCSGSAYSDTPLKDLTAESMRAAMKQNFETRLTTYTATVPYLLEQGFPNATWTLVTGSQGDTADRPEPAMTQGPLFSLATAASRELADSNIRFNELYMDLRVDLDHNAEKVGSMKASEFATTWENILADGKLKGGRMIVRGPADLKQVLWEPKVKARQV